MNPAKRYIYDCFYFVGGQVIEIHDSNDDFDMKEMHKKVRLKV